MKRQNVRKLTLISMLLLFPIIMWYFSPYLIMHAMASHIANGSFIIFILQFISAMFAGRIFCSYLCPMGGLQECSFLINDKPLRKSWKYNIKYGIWIVWVLSLILFYVKGSGAFKIDFLYLTVHGISIAHIEDYMIYYLIMLLFFIPAIIGGKRFACHYFCWMAPHMIFGEKIGRALHFPQLHIKANKEACISCGKCDNECPMSVDVKEEIEKGYVKSVECINCGACVDHCPKKALHYSMTPIKKRK